MPAMLPILLQLISLASQVAPEVVKMLADIKAQQGKDADTIFAEAGVTIEANNLKGLAILANLMAPKP